MHAAIAFDAPMVVVINNGGDPRTSTASAVRAGLTVVGTEMGGGGGVSHEGLAVCRRGVRNLLAHFGVLPAKAKEPPRPRPPLFTVSGPGKHIFATHDGVHLSGRNREVHALEDFAVVDPGVQIANFKHRGGHFKSPTVVRPSARRPSNRRRCRGDRGGGPMHGRKGCGCGG